MTDFRPTKETNPERWKNSDTPHGRTAPVRNDHPTVKRVALMIWLIDLVTPAGGKVLDPFCGSGTTGQACVRTGRPFIGIDKSQHYIDIASMRIRAEQAPLF